MDLVPPEKILSGDAVTIRCAHGDTVLYRLADLEMEMDGVYIQVEDLQCLKHCLCLFF